MRVLVVSCVFPPEPNVSAQTSAQVAEELARRGHRVTVLSSFPSRPSGRVYPGYTRRLFRREKDVAGFELIRCFSIASSESRVFSRFLENLSFGLTSGLALLAQRADVVYANTWPIIASGIVAIIARLRNIPLVMSIQDVYPESIISQNRIKPSSLLARLMRWVDKLVVRVCRDIIVISESFAAIYRTDRGIAPERLHVVPNWASDDSVHPNDVDGVKLRERYGIPPDAFVVAYGGNIGTAASVETVVRSFRFLEPDNDFFLLIAGAGSNLPACRKLANDIAPERIFFHTPWPIEETSAVLGAADLLVLPTQGFQSKVSVPSKMISYMLASRSIVALALPDTELADLVERSGCGWIIEPDQPEKLAIKLKQIATLPGAERARRGEAGRSFALKNLTRQVCLPKVVDLLESAADSERR